MSSYYNPLIERIESGVRSGTTVIDFRKVVASPTDPFTCLTDPTPDDFFRMRELAIEQRATIARLRGLLDEARSALVFAGPPEGYQ